MYIYRLSGICTQYLIEFGEESEKYKAPSITMGIDKLERREK